MQAAPRQIPRFFGHGLTVKDVQDDQSLLGKLDEPLLEAACERFGVRREWLNGAEPQVYSCHDFYKHPERVQPFLTKLRESKPEGELDGILIAPEGNKGEALVLLSELIAWVGDKPIYRYHLCSGWVFDYWKSRAYLTALVAVCWKNGVYIRGNVSAGEGNRADRQWRGADLLRGWRSGSFWPQTLVPRRYGAETRCVPFRS